MSNGKDSFGANRKGGKIPDRWLRYDPVGKEMEGTRFVAFKCPLDKKFFENRKDIQDEVFTIDILCEMGAKQGKKIGMVMDLTNTHRYYDPKEWHDRGIEHNKLHCPGHEVDQREDIVGIFNYKVDEYLRRADPDLLVGVHCTHGLNRTGYLIGRYLIDKQGWSAEDCIKVFNKCRGYPIERESYKEKLRWAEATRSSRLGTLGGNTSTPASPDS